MKRKADEEAKEKAAEEKRIKEEEESRIKAEAEAAAEKARMEAEAEEERERERKEAEEAEQAAKEAEWEAKREAEEAEVLEGLRWEEVTVKGMEGGSGLSVKNGLVDKVEKGSAGEKKGIKKGWKCLEVNGVASSDDKELSKALLGAKKAAKKYTLKICRPRTEEEIEVTLNTNPNPNPEQKRESKWRVGDCS